MTEITVMDDEKYNKLNILIESYNKQCDDNGFACILENKSYIILKKSFVDNCSEPMLRCVIAHEEAHITGVVDEEEADKWAMEQIDTEAQEILKDMWGLRHGHEYLQSQ
jgi:hypothetical protein